MSTFLANTSNYISSRNTLSSFTFPECYRIILKPLLTSLMVILEAKKITHSQHIPMHHLSKCRVLGQMSHYQRTTTAFKNRESRIAEKTAQALVLGIVSNNCSAKMALIHLFSWYDPVSCLRPLSG